MYIIFFLSSFPQSKVTYRRISAKSWTGEMAHYRLRLTWFVHRPSYCDHAVRFKLVFYISPFCYLSLMASNHHLCRYGSALSAISLTFNRVVVLLFKNYGPGEHASAFTTKGPGPPEGLHTWLTHPYSSFWAERHFPCPQLGS
jgi:hypothetical protein